MNCFDHKYFTKQLNMVRLKRTSYLHFFYSKRHLFNCYFYSANV